MVELPGGRGDRRNPSGELAEGAGVQVEPQERGVREASAGREVDLRSGRRRTDADDAALQCPRPDELPLRRKELDSRTRSVGARRRDAAIEEERRGLPRAEIRRDATVLQIHEECRVALPGGKDDECPPLVGAPSLHNGVARRKIETHSDLRRPVVNPQVDDLDFDRGSLARGFDQRDSAGIRESGGQEPSRCRPVEDREQTSAVEVVDADPPAFIQAVRHDGGAEAVRR